jgi:hypothetical protein
LVSIFLCVFMLYEIHSVHQGNRFRTW